MKNVILLLIMIVLAVVIYYGRSGNDDLKGEISMPEKVVAVEPETGDINNPNSDNGQDHKLEQMKIRYAELKEARKKMKMRLSRLASRLSRSEFPPDQAKAISNDMRQANYRLKNPKLLGAFSDTDEIDQELERLSDTNLRLDIIKQILDERKGNRS